MGTTATRAGFKHMVTCRCVLPQFRNRPNPPNHQFLVFSVLDGEGEVVPKVVRCNNCGVLHKVKELCSSTVIDRDEGAGLVSIEDIKMGLDERLVALLEREGVDQATWEAVRFNVDEGRWGETVVLTSERVDGSTQGKYLSLFGKGLFKVESFVRDEVASQGA